MQSGTIRNNSFDTRVKRARKARGNEGVDGPVQQRAKKNTRTRYWYPSTKDKRDTSVPGKGEEKRGSARKSGPSRVRRGRGRKPGSDVARFKSSAR